MPDEPNASHDGYAHHRHGEGHNPVAEAKSATWLGIIGNILLTVAKVVGGFISGSAALIADGVHSGSDVASSVLILIGLRVSQREPDDRHPYGHGKAETIAASSVAALLFLLAGAITWRAIDRLVHDAGHGRNITALAVYIEIGAILTKEALFQYKIRLGRRIRSMGLIADAWHHRSDVYSSLGAFAGILGAYVGGPGWHFLDDAAALVVSVFILKAGIDVFRETSSLLMDEAVKGELASDIRGHIREVRGVLDVEKLIVRRSGMDMLVDVHIEVPPEMTVREGHEISTRVKRHLEHLEELRITSVLVHIEPYCGEEHVDGSAQT